MENADDQLTPFVKYKLVDKHFSKYLNHLEMHS